MESIRYLGSHSRTAAQHMIEGLNSSPHFSPEICHFRRKAQAIGTREVQCFTETGDAIGQ